MTRTDDVLLEESRLHYDRLKSQWHTIDAKSSSFLQTSAMILTVLVMTINIIITSRFFVEFLYFMAISIVILCISLLLSIISTKLYKIIEPHIEVDINNIEINGSTKNVNLLLIDQYSKSIKSLSDSYDSKTKILRLAQSFLAGGVVVFAISLFFVGFLSGLPSAITP